jgi:hypothetical protein
METSRILSLNSSTPPFPPMQAAPVVNISGFTVDVNMENIAYMLALAAGLIASFLEIFSGSLFAPLLLLPCLAIPLFFILRKLMKTRGMITTLAAAVDSLTKENAEMRRDIELLLQLTRKQATSPSS